MTIELFAYGDESGIENSAPYCLLLGFIGSPRQWTIFKKDWREILDANEVQKFHAKKFFGRNRGRRLAPYEDWTSTHAHAFLESLVEVASRRRLYPIGGAVDVADFKSFTQAERNYLTGQFVRNKNGWRVSGASSRPYYFVMKLFVVEALLHADSNTQIHFYFDQQTVLKSYAVNIFNDWKNLPHPFGESLKADRLESIDFVDSTNEAGLQLADMYAYAYNRYIRDFHGDSDIDSDIGLILDAFTHKDKKEKPGIRFFDKPRLQDLLNSLHPYLQEKLKE